LPVQMSKSWYSVSLAFLLLLICSFIHNSIPSSKRCVDSFHLYRIPPFLVCAFVSLTTEFAFV
jgi:hypothetical protein